MSWIVLRRAAVGEGAGHDAGHPVEIARTPQLGQHPVDAVVLLADVLEQQDAAAGGPGRAGAQRGHQQAQRAAGGDAAGRAGDHGDGLRIPDHGSLLGPHQGAEQGAERVMRRALPDGDHGAEDRRPAQPDRHRFQHRGDIGVAGYDLGRDPGEAVPVHRLQGALRAVAAAGEHDPGDARVGERGPQVPGPHRVVAGQVAAHGAGVVRGRVGHRVQAGEPQRVQAGRQRAGIDRAADVEHGHPVPRRERARPGQ